MTKQRSDYEHDQAIKIIKVLVKHKVIPKAALEDDYMKTWNAAFEILDLLTT